MSISIIGGIFIDVKAWPNHEIKWRDSNAGKISYTAGGVARNIAENIGRMGISCNLFGIVGDDAIGHKVLSDTALGGVGVSHILKSKMEATGTSMIQLDEKGDLMCCTTDMGATASISTTYIENVWEYMENSDMIIVDTELEIEVLQMILDKANAKKIPVLIEPVSGEKCGKVAALEGELAYFTPNEVEFKVFEQAMASAQGKIQIQHLLKTCGADGIWWHTTDQPGKQFPVAPIEILDATGAGDAFVAGFACARSLQKNMETSIAFGHKLAALTLQSPLAVSEAITEILLQDV